MKQGNGRFIPAHNGLKVTCKNCGATKDWARREDNTEAIAFPPVLVCTAENCKKSKKNVHKLDKLVK